MKSFTRIIGHCAVALLIIWPQHINAANPNYSKQEGHKYNNLQMYQSVKIAHVTDDVGMFDFMQQALKLLFRFHQLFISDIDGPNCVMTPTCSNYGLQSITKYGPILGGIKTLDRLHRCGHDLIYYKIIDDGGRMAHEDPP